MNYLNYHLHYFSNVRFLMLHKFFFEHSLNIPFVKRLDLSFVLQNLEDADDVQISNYFYFFRFFFGRRAFVTQFNYFFSLGMTYYNITVMVYFLKNNVFFPMSFFSNDIFQKTKKTALDISHYQGSSIIELNDLQYFVERKTNVGLFNLYSGLSIAFYFNSVQVENEIFLSFFKFEL